MKQMGASKRRRRQTLGEFKKEKMLLNMANGYFTHHFWSGPGELPLLIKDLSV